MRGCQGNVHPGERLCDPTLGVSATCDECGVSRPFDDSAPCVRLIASDKESSSVCVVRGATELQCWARSGITNTVAIPADTREVLLRDDGASAPFGELYACLRSAGGGYSCLGNASNCSHAAVGDSGACAICEGKPSCRGDITLPAALTEPLIDLAITDGTLFTLGGAGLAAFDLPASLPDFWKGTPRELRVDHQGGGCMLSTLGEMACWTNPALPLLPSAWTGFRKWVPMTLPQACVLDGQGRVACGNVLDDPSPTPLPASNVVDVVASSSLVCALTREGRVLCWDFEGKPLELPASW
jgi:hypothetical protein